MSGNQSQNSEFSNKDEVKYQLLFDICADLITCVNEKGVIVNCNQRIWDYLGYTKEEIIGENFSKIIHPDDLKKAKRALETIIKKGLTYNNELKMVHKNGDLIDVHIDSAGFYDENKKFLHTICIIDNITNKKKQQKEFMQSEKQFNSLFHAMNEGVCIHEIQYDASGTPVDYKIIDINPAYQNILGFKKEDVIGHLATEAYNSPDAPYLDIYARVAESGDPFQFDTCYPPMKKHFSISVCSYEKGTFVTIFSDATESKIKENELRRRVHELESLQKLNEGIEIRKIELEKEVDQLRFRLGERPKYFKNSS